MYSVDTSKKLLCIRMASKSRYPKITNSVATAAGVFAVGPIAVRCTRMTSIGRSLVRAHRVVETTAFLV